MILTNPWGLALFSLAIPVTLLYFLKLRRERMTVGSVLLWTRSVEDRKANALWERLRRNWLLVLQLAILAMLAIAAAGPAWRGAGARGRTLALVLDGSASMAGPGRGGSRLAEAASLAERIAGRLGPADQAVVVLAGPAPRILAPLGGEGRVVRDALRRARPTDAPADLEAAIALARSLLRGVAGGEIHLFTDAAVPSQGGGREAPLAEHPVGLPVPNVGIVAFSVRALPSSPVDLKAFVRVQAFGDTPVTGTLLLLLGSRRLGEAVLTMGARGEVAQVFSFSAPEAGRGEDAVVEVRWIADQGPDSFPLDDRARAVLASPDPIRVLWIGEPDAFTERAILVNPRVEIRKETAEPGDLAGIDLVVCRGAGPWVPEGPPVLWIAPAQDDPRLRGAGYQDSPVLLDWRADNAILRFVDLGGLRIRRAPRIQRPEGMSVVATTTAGPLLLEGVLGAGGDGPGSSASVADPRARKEGYGRRMVLLALDPSESDLPLRVAYPLLVQNSVVHLLGEKGEAAFAYPTGATLVIPMRGGAGQAEVVGPDGATVTHPVRAGRLLLPPLERAGLYRVRSAGRGMLVAANLLSGGESDLAAIAPDPGEERPAPRAAASVRPVERTLAPAFLVLGLLLLVMEWGAYHHRLLD